MQCRADSRRHRDPGIVFSGANDRVLRAYNTTDGTIVWEFDSNREFETVNGVKAKGASMNGAGPSTRSLRNSQVSVFGRT
jgi:outer membrane protein assembly factor BamB